MSTLVPINRPGALTNPPQHLLDGGVVIDERSLGATVPAPFAPAIDPARPPDPHPAREEHPFRAAHPGAANPAAEADVAEHDIGPNPAEHDGTAPPRPRNAGSGPR